MSLRRAMFFACTGLFGILPACRRETDEYESRAARQHAYFPLEAGRYVEYAVDSIVYDFAPGGGTVRDSMHFLAREVVGDTIRDNAGRLVYTVERYERPDTAGAAWQLRRVWTAARTASEAVRTEENLRFQRLVFPLFVNTAWNGNRYFDENREIEIAGERMQPFRNWNYTVESLDAGGSVGSFTFDSLLVVVEVDDNNAIERRYSRAVYAKNVGLVYRIQQILDSQYCNQLPPPPDCLTRPWELKAERGYILRQTVVGFN